MANEFKVKNGLKVGNTEIIDSNGQIDWGRLKNKVTAVAGSSNGLLSSSDKSKLDGIDSGAQVNQTITAGTGLSGGGSTDSLSINLSHLGIDGLTDPNDDRIMFWDDSAGASQWLDLGSNLSISGTTISSTNTTYSVGDGELTQKNFTTTLKNKLDGIEAGATADQDLSSKAPLASPSFTGDVVITDDTPLFIKSSTNGASAGIKFSDNSSGGSYGQHGNLLFYHSNTASYGSTAAFILKTSEPTSTILADGKLMYGEGIYSKPSSGTGAGTRKDSNWDTAYGWGDHASASYATQSYVGTQISNLVDSSPAALNTLNELAAALGDDANFSTTVTNSIATKLPSSSYTAADVLTKIKTVDGSGSGLDADTVDGIQGSAITHQGDSVALTGDVTGSTTVASDGSISVSTTVADDSHNHVISNVDGLQTALDGKLPLSGGTMTGSISLDNNNLTDIGKINFENHEGSDYGVTGDVMFDENFYGDTEYGTAWSSNNGGGLAVYNEDGWGRILTDRNIQWHTATFDGLKVGSNTVWHAGNDGSGSGLDADKLDGNHASAFSTASGVEDNADVTDTTNVVAALTAGTNVAIAADGTISSTDTNTDTWRGIQDNLTSTSTTDSLSAKQGKVLKESIDAKTSVSTPAMAASVALDFNNVNFTLNLNQNINLTATNLANNIGATGTIVLIQDTTGGRTIGTFPSEFKTPNGEAISQVTTANSVSAINYYTIDANTILVNYLGDFK